MKLPAELGFNSIQFCESSSCRRETMVINNFCVKRQSDIKFSTWKEKSKAQQKKNSYGSKY